MGAWDRFAADAPELAAAIRGRFEATGLALLATLRADGAPRISAVEAFFGGGELWLGMMHGSLKARDLLRDARFALHAATVDKQVAEGDAKVSGRAVEITVDDDLARFVGLVSDHLGGPPPEPFHAFRLDVTEASFLRPEGDHLVIERWREGEGVARIERR